MELESVVARLAEQVERRFYGKYRGFVVDNADPENLGRLKLTVPSVLGEEVVTGWAAPCVPYGGGAGHGFLFVPEVEAGVWVEFEEGDLEFPIWVGTFWSKPGGESELPKPNDPDGAEQGSVQSPPTRKIVKTVKGHTLQLEDADGEEMVLIVEATNGHVVVMNKDGIKVTDGVNAHTVVLDGEGIKVTDGVSGHEVELAGAGIKVTDGANGHEVELAGGGIRVADGVNAGNEIVMDGQGLTCQDKNGNKLAMDATSGGIPGTPGAQLNGGKKVCLEGLVTWLMSHTHLGNLGAPCPLNPADIAKLAPQLAAPDGDILSQKVKLG